MSAVTPPRTERDTLRLGTRASTLAHAQSRIVADRLTAVTGTAVELVDVSTRGDVDHAPLATIGGAGVFVSAVRDALLAGEVDVAVHSLKDLPTDPADGHHPRRRPRPRGPARRGDRPRRADPR